MRFRHLLFLLMSACAFSSVAYGYEGLDKFSNAKDVDALLGIWGEEANQNAHNAQYGSDNNAPIFNSSYDWHSSVHAHFASVYTGKTLNQRNLVSSIIAKYNNDGVRGELSFKTVYDEKMYGYPWLLMYADYLADVEPNAYQTLLPLINEVYRRSYTLLYNVSYSTYSRSISSGYRNYNFLALGVYTYAKHINDQTRMNLAKNLVASYAPRINWTSVAKSDFFAPKAIAAWTYKVLGIRGKAANNLKNAYNRSTNLVPNSLKGYASHVKGRVMSSAWGFWLMYQETQQNRYLNAYIKAVDLIFQDLKNTRYHSNYFLGSGHWIPHFGVIALKMTKDYPVNMTEPVLISDIIVSPAEFTTHVDITFPVDQANSLVTFEVINWANRVVQSKRFYSAKGNQKVRFYRLSTLWAGDYTLKVAVGNKVFTKKIIKKRADIWWQ